MSPETGPSALPLKFQPPVVPDVVNSDFLFDTAAGVPGHVDELTNSTYKIQGKHDPCRIVCQTP